MGVFRSYRVRQMWRLLSRVLTFVISSGGLEYHRVRLVHFIIIYYALDIFFRG